jgi:tellurite resistance protein TehA-like permease
MWATLLIIHIMSGSLALLTGPAAMAFPKRHGWHTRLGTCYVALVGLLSGSAIGLTVMKPALWWLAVIAGFTLAAVLAGRELRRRHPPGWLPLHISLMCGSYVSLATALLVVNLGLNSVYAWALPTVAGTPLIARRAYLAAARPRQGDISGHVRALSTGCQRRQARSVP